MGVKDCVTVNVVPDTGACAVSVTVFVTVFTAVAVFTTVAVFITVTVAGGRATVTVLGAGGGSVCVTVDPGSVTVFIIVTVVVAFVPEALAEKEDAMGLLEAVSRLTSDVRIM